jgi:hypothetical protein
VKLVASYRRVATTWTAPDKDRLAEPEKPRGKRR